MKCVKTAVPLIFFLHPPKHLKGSEVNDRLSRCGPALFLRSDVSAVRGGWTVRIHPSSRLLELLPLPLSMCSAPSQDRRDASHQRTCLRPLSALPTLQRYVCKFLAFTSVTFAFEWKLRSAKLTFSLKQRHLYWFQNTPQDGGLTFLNPNACPNQIHVHKWLDYL